LLLEVRKQIFKYHQNHFTKFPIDVLKIDRSFISHMLENTKEQAIVKTIIEMGRHLNMEVLAEGIETKEQAAFLSAYGCHTGQGYFYSRPVPLATLLDTKMPPCNVVNLYPKASRH